MVIISHRGNTVGSNTSLENNPSYIERSLNLGFDVECDVFYDKKLWLGHDNPTCEIDINWLKKYSSKLWIHCKNLDAITYLLDYKELNIFGHNNDDYVLTSKGNIFCRPGVLTNKKTVIVMPEMTPIYTEETLSNCYGVLTDYPVSIKERNLDKFLSGNVVGKKNY